MYMYDAFKLLPSMQRSLPRCTPHGRRENTILNRTDIHPCAGERKNNPPSRRKFSHAEWSVAGDQSGPLFTVQIRARPSPHADL